MKIKKIIASLLTMAMVTTVMPVMQREVKAEVYGNFEYSVNDGSVEITKYTGSEINVVVPAEIEGYEVTSIGDSAFLKCKNIVSVKLPASITHIGDNAFYQCEALESINIPDGITSISDKTFYYCLELDTIALPEGVTSIGNGAFYWTSLDSFDIPDGVTSIGSEAFGYCDFTSIEIPNGITRIENDTFTWCSSLESIEIPESVTEIGMSAFYCCSRLKKVRMSDNVTSIGAWAFSGCSYLEDIVLSKNITRIERNTFYSCRNLPKIEIPTGVTYIGYYAFYDCQKLTSVNIPYGVITIDLCAFFYCQNLVNIEIPNSVVTISKQAFCGTKITSIEIPESVTTIGDQAFYYCNVLKEVNIPSSVTSIGSEAFANTKVSDVEIPKSVTKIGEKAFPATTIIYGYKGSEAEIYATTYGNQFVLLKDDSVITESEEVEINGYQMNVAIGGIRIIYSVEPEIDGLEVVERGIVLGLKDRASEEEMQIYEDTDYVVHYAATSAGLMNGSYGTSKTAESYTMTFTQSIEKMSVAGLEAGYYVRAYAKLSDGSYVYSSISQYSIFSVAKKLYDNQLMANIDRHQYLYDKILSVVQPGYTEVEYTKGSLALPDFM